MSRIIAMQMDPMETVNIAGDSSFDLMLSAQKRGYTIYHYDVKELTWTADGRLMTKAHPVTVQKIKGDHFSFGDAVMLDMGADVDVIMMRQDPPFDIGYITGALLLERIADKTLVVNDPRSVRDAPEKMFVLDYAQYMPPTLVTRSLQAVRDFQDEHGAVVIKPLHGNGGKAIFRINKEGENLGALMEVFNQTWREPHMVQPFLPDVEKGDKRIVLVDGVVAGAINRKPGKGEFRSNLAVGGYAEATTLTPREEEICAAMGPELKKRGLVFVGIDVIGGKWLTEINVTSPTGIVAISAYDDIDCAGMIWDAVEARLAARGQ